MRVPAAFSLLRPRAIRHFANKKYPRATRVTERKSAVLMKDEAAGKRGAKETRYRAVIEPPARIIIAARFTRGSFFLFPPKVWCSACDVTLRFCVSGRRRRAVSAGNHRGEIDGDDGRTFFFYSRYRRESSARFVPPLLLRRSHALQRVVRSAISIATVRSAISHVCRRLRPIRRTRHR